MSASKSNTHDVSKVNFASAEKIISIGNVIIHALSCAVHHWVMMHLGSLESTQEGRVALSCTTSNYYLVYLSHLSAKYWQTLSVHWVLVNLLANTRLCRLTLCWHVDWHWLPHYGHASQTIFGQYFTDTQPTLLSWNDGYLSCILAQSIFGHGDSSVTSPVGKGKGLGGLPFQQKKRLTIHI